MVRLKFSAIWQWLTSSSSVNGPFKRERDLQIRSIYYGATGQRRHANVQAECPAENAPANIFDRAVWTLFQTLFRLTFPVAPGGRCTANWKIMSKSNLTQMSEALRRICFSFIIRMPKEGLTRSPRPSSTLLRYVDAVCRRSALSEAYYRAVSQVSMIKGLVQHLLR
jgi:hypothetical protein